MTPPVKEGYLRPRTVNWMINGDDDSFEKLTPREFEILSLAAQGHPYKVIAEKLGISCRTIRFHMMVVFEKFGVQNREQACIAARQRGLIPTDLPTTPRAALRLAHYYLALAERMMDTPP